MNEFNHGSIATAKRLAFIYELKRNVKKIIKKRVDQNSRFIKSKYSEIEAKKIVVNQGLGLVNGNQLSWFYTAFERDDKDPLTNFTLNFINGNVDRNKKILVTGCGTGIMVFHLADQGFKSVEGRDLLPECVKIASILKDKFDYSETNFLLDDGFKPAQNGKYDVITALHWVFSAWMGNYGNTPIGNPKDNDVRNKLLTDFFGEYSSMMNPGCLMFIELIDAVADYRDPFDHPMGLESYNIYPVRFTPEQVAACGKVHGLDLIEKRLSVSYGHQPRTTFVLQRN
jgi:2-polyprenyl-3-methyl-5-hydroxy-6-metoxy-1,4-benzoquinol methylase